MSIKRELIMTDFDTRMKAIKTTAGYLTNLGNNIYAWKDNDLNSSQMPGMIYRDRMLGKREGVIGKTRWALQVDMVLFVEGNATEVRKLVADVLKAIGSGFTAKWGGYAQTTEISDGSETAIERHDKTEGAATLTINIIYDTPLWEC